MTIQDLIAEKRRQIGLLERHIKMLEQMATEEGNSSRSAGSSPRGRKTAARKVSSRRVRGRRGGGSSRAGMVEAYLKAHEGPQPAKEMAVALGMKPAQLHGAIHSGLKTGRFVRGKERATFALGGSTGGAKRTPKTRRGTRAGRRRKGKPEGPATQQA